MQHLTIYNQQAASFLNTDFTLAVLRNECAFAEGPVWNEEGYYLYSDIPRNEICKTDATGKHAVYLKPSGCLQGNNRNLSEQPGSNGLAYDTKGNLLVCQHGEGAVALFDGIALQTFIPSFQGKPFNSPNDIVCGKDGSIYFSDPPYGLKDQQLDPERYQPVAGIYCWRGGKLHRITDMYRFPNGVCLSPDGSKLFTCSSKPFEASVQQFDADSLSFEKEICNEAGDGIKCDRYGHLYLCTKEGIKVFTMQGETLALLQFETVPANCCWGGKDGTDLFVTARQNIFLIRNLLVLQDLPPRRKDGKLR